MKVIFDKIERKTKENKMHRMHDKFLDSSNRAGQCYSLENNILIVTSNVLSTDFFFHLFFLKVFVYWQNNWTCLSCSKKLFLLVNYVNVSSADSCRRYALILSFHSVLNRRQVNNVLHFFIETMQKNLNYKGISKFPLS